MRISARPVLLMLASTLAATGLWAQKAGGPAPASAPAPRPQGGSTTAVSRGTSGHARTSWDAAPGFAHIARPATMPRPTSNVIVLPGALPRATVMPDPSFWAMRDIEAECRRMSRTGYIPTTPVRDLKTVIGWATFPAGWWAYALVVPPMGKVHIRLRHPNEGWFRLHLVDIWGNSRRQGMLQNIHPTGNPEVSYYSPLNSATVVYVIVDDPGWMSSSQKPYTLTIDRSWDVSRTKAPTLPPAMGIWAHTPAKETPVDTPPVPGEAPKVPTPAG